MASIDEVAREQGSQALADLLRVSFNEDGTPKNGGSQPSFTDGTTTVATPTEIETADLTVTDDSGKAKLSISVWERLERYIDYINGNDSNDGATPYRAHKTIQHGYNQLESAAVAGYTAGSNGQGIGRLTLLPGAHDVGTHLAVAYNYPVEIDGRLSGGIPYTFAGGATPTQATIMSSSAAGTELIVIGDSSSPTNSLSKGTRIRDVAFVAAPGNTDLTALVRSYATDYLELERAQGYTSDGSTISVPLLEQAPGAGSQDNAWLRMRDCKTDHVALYRCLPGTNFNRSRIDGCVVQFGGSIPMIDLEGDWWNGIVIGNNLEGGAGAAHVSVGNSSPSHICYSNQFIGNAGESSSSTYPFYDFIAAKRNIVMGGDCTATDGGSGVWVNLHANSYQNTIINPWASYAGTAGFKRKISDSSGYPAETILHNHLGRIAYEKSASGVSITTSDFVSGSVPDDGSGPWVTHDSTSGETRMWMVINGAFVSVELA